MHLAGQLAVEAAGLLARADPARRRRVLGVPDTVRAEQPLEELLHPGHRHHQRTRLPGLPDVLAVAAARRYRLGDQRVEFVEPGVHRTEPLVMQPREVLDLDAEGLHGDLELDERALGRPYRLFQAVLRSSLLFFLPAVRVRHAPRLRGGARDAPTLPARRAPISPLAPRTPVPEVVNMSNSPPWYAVSCLP